MKLPMIRTLLLCLVAAATPLLATSAFAQAKEGVPLMKEPLQGEAKPGPARTINWEQLVPANWDPFKDFKDLNFQLLDDSDPRAARMLKKMREAWDNAPTNPQLVGQNVRIPGFVVPLEDTKEGLKEFLLVPYFGACIHSPPPPANQIIHVIADKPFKSKEEMDAVWVSGIIELATSRTDMGDSGYRLRARKVEAYKEPRPK